MWRAAPSRASGRRARFGCIGVTAYVLDGEMRCVVPAHWSRLNVIDGEAAVLGRDGLFRVRLNYPDGRNVALSKEPSFDRTINHLRHGPDMGTILRNSSSIT